MRRRSVVLFGTAVAAAQAGHLVAYAVRFGAAAGVVQSQGPHAYFALTAQLALGLAGLIGVAALGIIGAARLLGGTRVTRRPVMAYLPLLFLLQLALYAGQETIEAAAAGSAGPDAVALLLWGAVGQLPAAIAAALALSWLEANVEAAVAAIRRPRLALRLAPAARQPQALQPQLAGVLPQHVRAAQAERGPPRDS